MLEKLSVFFTRSNNQFWNPNFHNSFHHKQSDWLRNLWKFRIRKLRAKGQLISKQNCWAGTSSKKRTICTQDSILSAFCSFFGRSYSLDNFVSRSTDPKNKQKTKKQNYIQSEVGAMHLACKKISSGWKNFIPVLTFPKNV